MALTRITNNSISNSSVTNTKIAPGNVDFNSIANNSIDSSKLLDGAVSTNKLSNTAVTAPKLDTSVLPIGVNQSWSLQSRGLNTTYTNNTGRPIQVMITVAFPSVSNATVNIYINGSIMGALGDPNGSQPALLLQTSFVVPSGNTYSVNTASGSPSLSYWAELR